jgi:hypothetical protein
MQQRVADCGDVSPAVLGGSYQCFRQHHPRLRSNVYINRSRTENQGLMEALTAVAKSSIALPAMRASSWLSLISTLMICTTRLNSPPRDSKSRADA